MDIDSVQDAELDELRIRLARMEGRNKRKSAKGSFSVKKKLRVAPITKRMRSTGITPRTVKKADTRTSRSAQISPRNLFGSGTNSRSASRPPLSQQGKMEQFLKGNKAMYNLLTSSSKKKVSFATTLKSRKVRHNNARKVLNKMPAGGKSYAQRRMTSRKPKGAYRGAVMPRWAKGETKHILMNDACKSGVTTPITCVNTGTLTSLTSSGLATQDGEGSQSIGDLDSWCLNPISQNLTITGRNGRSVDATYVRIQGHIRNAASPTIGETVSSQKAYVRMLVLMVKGNRPGEALATFSKADLFRKIDNSVVGYETPRAADASANPPVLGGSGAAAVRTLQLPVNKSLYTVLADQKMQLASKNESFGSSDRLFDLKIPLKQKIKFNDAESCCSFRSNQLVFVMYSVDPECPDAAPGGNDIKFEFESKFSYKDL